MNFKQLADRLDLEEDEFLEMVELFIETSASDLNKLQLAIDQKNMRQAFEAAHSIKGASGNLGFKEAHELAKEIEQGARNNRPDRLAESLQVLKQKLNMIAALACG